MGPADVVNVYEAKTRLSALLAEVEAGGSVVIARAGRPIARLVPYVPDVRPARVPGLLRGRIHISRDFDAVDEEIAAAFEAAADASLPE